MDFYTRSKPEKHNKFTYELATENMLLSKAFAIFVTKLNNNSVALHKIMDILSDIRNDLDDKV